MNEAMRKILEDEDRLRRQAEMMVNIGGRISPTVSALAKLHENSAITRFAEEAMRVQDSMRAMLGPMEDLSQLRVSDRVLGISSEIAAACEAFRGLETRFSFPAIDEATRLFREYETSGLVSAMRHVQDQTAGIQRAIDSMRVPWLDMQDSLRSMGGFAELQRIGAALQNLPSFDAALTDSLRLDLGDWRLPIDWPGEIFTDVAARTAFYEARGLDIRLTDFPAPAFRQSMALAGLAVAPPPLLDLYEGDVEDEETEEEEGFARTNAAHHRLLHFETHLRRFIDESMRQACGENWIKQRVPGEIRKAWLKKREKTVAAGEQEWPLITYADFTDYVQIIVRKDNWEQVFEAVFRRKEFVMESLQRLYPIRLCTMHARLITQDDELYLLVETMRILKAIGVQ